MRHWTLSTTIGAAILISSAGSARQAPVVISGNYVLDEAQSDNAFQAIEEAIAGLPNARRPLARTMLRKSIAVHTMRISVAGRRVGITYDDKAPIVVWIGNEPVKWKLIEVLVFDVSAKANGEAISIEFRGEDNDRIITYRAAGSDLIADTVMFTPLAPKQIVYKQIFRRTN